MDRYPILLHVVIFSEKRPGPVYLDMLDLYIFSHLFGGKSVNNALKSFTHPVGDQNVRKPKL